ncbi:TfoX/Sxy family protein [Agathobaculum sp.]|uniref:TfoX/Sxy family protein n=1 Tax=Agathobaculum sp. TaxID=2048138 RepID=UPI002A835074|nr:TfoX/Sxy family protein [Agathobaculum sp.]MDY3617908.1 TfoX/Sxy family protein [Agathobaculum sp.]
MASTLEFVQYVCDQLSEAGTITFKRMFGEFGLYCDGKFFATVEDDQLCLKMTEAGKELLGEPVVIEPHEGAHYFYIENLDDRTFLGRLVRATCGALPARKPRKRKKASEQGSDA